MPDNSSTIKQQLSNHLKENLNLDTINLVTKVEKTYLHKSFNIVKRELDVIAHNLKELNKNEVVSSYSDLSNIDIYDQQVNTCVEEILVEFITTHLLKSEVKNKVYSVTEVNDNYNKINPLIDDLDDKLQAAVITELREGALKNLKLDLDKIRKTPDQSLKQNIRHAKEYLIKCRKMNLFTDEYPDLQLGESSSDIIVDYLTDKIAALDVIQFRMNHTAISDQSEPEPPAPNGPKTSGRGG